MATAIEKLYIKKILGHEINPNTGAEWTVEDVPAKWQQGVAEEVQCSETESE